MHVFDINRILINSYPFSYLFEVAFRSAFTFFIVYIFLRLIGRRGVKQMTLFEIVIILTLGSAAGDVALNEDSPLLPVIVTFVIIVGLYRLFTYLINKTPYLQSRLEGKPIVLIKEGQLHFDNATKQSFAYEEFVMELREKGVEHLGQVKLALLEIDGNLSVYFFSDEAVKPGLLILPASMIKTCNKIPRSDIHSCIKCSFTLHIDACDEFICPVCEGNSWAVSSRNRRVT